MVDVTEKDISDVMGDFMTRIDGEYKDMTESELRERWWFAYCHKKTLRQNFYMFTESLDNYKTTCRRWEELHNGHQCVVERVRDKYLMPKIDEFISNLGDVPMDSFD